MCTSMLRRCLSSRSGAAGQGHQDKVRYRKNGGFGAGDPGARRAESHPPRAIAWQCSMAVARSSPRRSERERGNDSNCARRQFDQPSSVGLLARVTRRSSGSSLRRIAGSNGACVAASSSIFGTESVAANTKHLANHICGKAASGQKPGLFARAAGPLPLATCARANLRSPHTARARANSLSRNPCSAWAGSATPCWGQFLVDAQIAIASRSGAKAGLNEALLRKIGVRFEPVQNLVDAVLGRRGWCFWLRGRRRRLHRLGRRPRPFVVQTVVRTPLRGGLLAQQRQQLSSQLRSAVFALRQPAQRASHQRAVFGRWHRGCGARHGLGLAAAPAAKLRPRESWTAALRRLAPMAAMECPSLHAPCFQFRPTTRCSL